MTEENIVCMVGFMILVACFGKAFSMAWKATSSKPPHMPEPENKARKVTLKPKIGSSELMVEPKP